MSPHELLLLPAENRELDGREHPDRESEDDRESCGPTVLPELRERLVDQRRDVCVCPPGPPPVIAKIWSKSLSPPMRPSIRLIVIAGASSGRVTYQNRFQ